MSSGVLPFASALVEGALSVTESTGTSHNSSVNFKNGKVILVRRLGGVLMNLGCYISSAISLLGAVQKEKANHDEVSHTLLFKHLWDFARVASELSPSVNHILFSRVADDKRFYWEIKG